MATVGLSGTENASGSDFVVITHQCTGFAHAELCLLETSSKVRCRSAMNSQKEFHTLSDLLRWLILEYWSQPREQVPITGEQREAYIRNLEECLGPAAKRWRDPLIVDSPVRSPSVIAAESWLGQYQGAPQLAGLIALFNNLPNADASISVALDTPERRDSLIAVVTQADLELAALLVPQYASDPLWAELHRIINDVEREDQTKPTIRALLGDPPRAHLREYVNELVEKCGLSTLRVFDIEDEGPRCFLIVRHPGPMRPLRIQVWSEAEAGEVPRIHAGGFAGYMRAWQAAREAQLDDPPGAKRTKRKRMKRRKATQIENDIAEVAIVESENASPNDCSPTPSDLIGMTKAAELVARSTGEDCADDTIRRRVKDGTLQAYEVGGFLKVSEAEVLAKVNLMKKTVGRKSRDVRKGDA